MGRIRPWEILEVVGFVIVSLAVYRLWGQGWALLALGIALVLIANAHGRS